MFPANLFLGDQWSESPVYRFPELGESLCKNVFKKNIFTNKKGVNSPLVDSIESKCLFLLAE